MYSYYEITSDDIHLILFPLPVSRPTFPALPSLSARQLFQVDNANSAKGKLRLVVSNHKHRTKVWYRFYCVCRLLFHLL